MLILSSVSHKHSLHTSISLSLTSSSSCPSTADLSIRFKRYLTLLNFIVRFISRSIRRLAWNVWLKIQTPHRNVSGLWLAETKLGNCIQLADRLTDIIETIQAHWLADNSSQLTDQFNWLCWWMEWVMKTVRTINQQNTNNHILSDCLTDVLHFFCNFVVSFNL